MAKEGFGGARGSRTSDLLNSIQALSQLSYGPSRSRVSVIRGSENSDYELLNTES